MILILISIVIFKLVVTVLNKFFLVKDITPSQYLLVQTLVITLLSPILFLIEPFSFQLNVVSVIILVLIALFRALDLKTYSFALKTISPLEMICYLSVTIIMAYVVDMFLGITVFNIFVMMAIFITLVGTFIIARSRILKKEVSISIALLLVAVVAKGYLILWSTQYMSATAYLSLTFFITSVFLVAKNPKAVKQIPKYAWKATFVIQAVELVILYLGTILISQGSVTLNQFTYPATLFATILLTPVLDRKLKEKPSKRKYVGATIVLLGIIVYSILEL